MNLICGLLAQVYTELTSRMVMTMEWVEGARLSDQAMLDTYGLEGSRLVDTMVRHAGVQCAYDDRPAGFSLCRGCPYSLW